MEKLTIRFRRSSWLAAGASGTQIPLRRAASLGDLRRPCSSTQIQSQGAKRKFLSPCASWGAKRARSALGCGGGGKPAAVSVGSPPQTTSSTCKDWTNLGDGPAGLIAEFTLATDVANYVRFRIACRPWHRCSPDPRTSGLDSRFLPREWIMLDKALAGPRRRRRRFLNVSTGECIRMNIPELDDDDHRLLALTPEGLLLLLHEATLIVRLLNPLTHQLTDFPRLTELLRARGYEESAERLLVGGAGLVADASTVAVFFSCPMVLAVAKPGDESWTTVVSDEYMNSVLPFAGRFYCATGRGVMVLDITSDEQQPPRLVVVAERGESFYFSLMAHSLHLVDNGGELMLVHRCLDSNYRRNYDVYRVDLEAGLLVPVKSFNGRAVFMGMSRTISVSAGVFPSISADIIYLAYECDRQIMGYNIAYGSRVPIPDGWECPESIIDCLCNCIQR